MKRLETLLLALALTIILVSSTAFTILLAAVVREHYQHRHAISVISRQQSVINAALAERGFLVEGVSTAENAGGAEK